MRVRNYLPENDPYAESKTELQWRQENRALLPKAIGEDMWTNQHCGVYTCYYTYEETRPATPEDMAAWGEERRERRREQKRRREAARAALASAHAEAEVKEEAMEKARIESLVARLRRYVGIDPAKVICLDTETTGLYPKFDEILQLSIIDGTGAALFDEYFRPKAATEWLEAEAVNGISPDMVADKSSIDEYVTKISDILADADLIVGYNLPFDLSFLADAGIEIEPETPTVDVMQDFAEIYGDWSEYHRDYRWQKLSVCAAYFGYKGSGSYHDSLEDVRATLFCYYAMTRWSPDEN